MSAPYRTAPPRVPDEEPADTLLSRLRRRALMVSLIVVTLALYSALFPVLALAAVLLDQLLLRRQRRPRTALRLLCMGWAYLASEVFGVLWLFLVWLWALPRSAEGRASALARGAAALQHRWTAALLAGTAALFRLRFVVEMEPSAAQVLRGPAVILIRHSSLFDTLLPTTFLSARFGLRLRFVLKRELLVDPCLDIAGHFLKNHFVRRDGGSSSQEIAQIRALAAGITDKEWGLIYPEGTRFTVAKQRRVLLRLQERDPALYAQAQALQQVLPPQLGGALALLDGAPQADAVLFAHHGLEGAGRFADLWNGKLLDRTVTLRLWRVPRAQIPTERAARVAWLYREWRRVDAWVVAQASFDSPHVPAGAGTRGPPALRSGRPDVDALSAGVGLGPRRARFVDVGGAAEVGALGAAEREALSC